LDVASGGITNAPTGTMRFMSIDASYIWSGIADVIDDGLEFGVAHSDYSAAEIEEALEAIESIDLGDKVAQEQANRWVRSIGTFASAINTAGSAAQFNDGKPVKTKLNWKMSIGDTLVGWVRNGSGVKWLTEG